MVLKWLLHSFKLYFYFLCPYFPYSFKGLNWSVQIICISIKTLEEIEFRRVPTIMTINMNLNLLCSRKKIVKMYSSWHNENFSSFFIFYLNLWKYFSIFSHIFFIFLLIFSSHLKKYFFSFILLFSHIYLLKYCFSFPPPVSMNHAPGVPQFRAPAMADVASPHVARDIPSWAVPPRRYPLRERRAPDFLGVAKAGWCGLRFFSI